MDEQPMVMAGRYDLISEIAAGGMGTVYRAHDRQLHRDVAVKLMRPELGREPEFAQRFALEARRTARFSHPHIVSIHDYGTDEGNQFIVMELVGGGNVAQLINRRGRLSPERAVRIGAEVAAALQVAHRHGIVHRDVKPANILLTPEGTAKLTDLGVAQAADDAHITTTGGAIGTADYLSPEQVEGKLVGPATDIYALGIVLFEMLTGRRPFNGESASAVALSRLTTDPPDPRRETPEVPAALAAIVMRCLARDPAKRYASARGLAIALRRWLGRQTVRSATSVPPVPTERQAIAFHTEGPQPAVLVQAAAVSQRHSERGRQWLLLLVLLLLVAAGFAGQRLLASVAGTPDSDGLTTNRSSPTPVIAAAIPSPEIDVPVTPTPVTPQPAPPDPDTPAPSLMPTPPPPATQPATQPPPASATPPPAVVATAAGTPAQTVARFYRLAADGSFDRAYALWSQRMRTAYPRAENLEQRFDNTTSIAIHRLDLLRQDAAYAVVGVEFTETYEGGSWRRFDGSWELVRSQGEWLLDAPHF